MREKGDRKGKEKQIALLLQQHRQDAQYNEARFSSPRARNKRILLLAGDFVDSNLLGRNAVGYSLVVFAIF